MEITVSYVIDPELYYACKTHHIDLLTTEDTCGDTTYIKMIIQPHLLNRIDFLLGDDIILDGKSAVDSVKYYRRNGVNLVPITEAIYHEQLKKSHKEITKRCFEILEVLSYTDANGIQRTIRLVLRQRSANNFSTPIIAEIDFDLVDSFRDFVPPKWLCHANEKNWIIQNRKGILRGEILKSNRS